GALAESPADVTTTTPSTPSQHSAPRPAATAAPAPPPASKAPQGGASGRRSLDMADPFSVDESFNRRRGGQFMRRVFVRRATIATSSPAAAISADKVAAARNA